MKRYVLTGTPGAGKTTILRALGTLGYRTVAEAATVVIATAQDRGVAEPWTDSDFLDTVVAEQRRRQESAGSSPNSAGSSPNTVQFHDRSPICTHALSVFLGHPISTALRAEIDRVIEKSVYQRQVFFVRNLGFCEPSAARRITFAQSLEFERVHEESYRAFGYELIDVPAGELTRRVAMIQRVLNTLRQ